jgi:hypothetical protein
MILSYANSVYLVEPPQFSLAPGPYTINVSLNVLNTLPSKFTGLVTDIPESLLFGSQYPDGLTTDEINFLFGGQAEEHTLLQNGVDDGATATISVLGYNVELPTIPFLSNPGAYFWAYFVNGRVTEWNFEYTDPESLRTPIFASQNYAGLTQDFAEAYFADYGYVVHDSPVLGQWTPIDAVFTVDADTVDFNNLTTAQRAAIAATLGWTNSAA